MTARRTLLALAALLLFGWSPTGAMSIDPVAPRIEEEIKLAVDQKEERGLWSYLETSTTNGVLFSSINAALEPSVTEEVFTDVYFDPPELSLLRRDYGIRFRYRDTVSRLDDPKDGKELIQV